VGERVAARDEPSGPVLDTVRLRTLVKDLLVEEFASGRRTRI
jgi:hypothetical protein